MATVVNKKILVTHGGVSSITDLEIIGKIDRHKVSLLDVKILLTVESFYCIFQPMDGRV